MKQAASAKWSSIDKPRSYFFVCRTATSEMGCGMGTATCRLLLVVTNIGLDAIRRYSKRMSERRHQATGYRLQEKRPDACSLTPSLTSGSLFPQTTLSTSTRLGSQRVEVEVAWVRPAPVSVPFRRRREISPGSVADAREGVQGKGYPQTAPCTLVNRFVGSPGSTGGARRE
jgi:hypothetical protein